MLRETSSPRRQNLAFLLLAVVAYCTLFEHFPRPGWVDAAIYGSYAIVPDAYKYVDGYSLALDGATYQHSRLGYILPLRWLSSFLGPVHGRYFYNLILFVLYGIAVVKVTSIYIKRLGDRTIALTFLLFNPSAIIPIVSGGADGPSAVYSLMSLAALSFAISSRKRFPLLQAGAWFGLSVATHLFSIIPFFFGVLVLAFRHAYLGRSDADDFSAKGVREKGASYVSALTFFLLGFLFVIFLLDAVASHLGLRQFFLSYSLGRAHNSLQGAGAKFIPSLEYAVRNGALWLGILLSLLAAVVVRRICKRSYVEFKCASVALESAIIGLFLPIAFVVYFDLVVGGSLSAAPHYFSVFWPCFSLAFVFFVSSLDYIRRGAWMYCLVILVLICNVLVSLSPVNNLAHFAAYRIDTRALLRSQLSFIDVISRLVAYDAFNMVYRVKVDEDGSEYVDYYDGRRRTFSHLDTLAYTFPWVGDKIHRVNWYDFPAGNKTIDSSLQTVLLATTARELDTMVELMRSELSVDGVIVKHCDGYVPYKWCIAVVSKTDQERDSPLSYESKSGI